MVEMEQLIEEMEREREIGDIWTMKGKKSDTDCVKAANAGD